MVNSETIESDQEDSRSIGDSSTGKKTTDGSATSSAALDQVSGGVDRQETAGPKAKGSLFDTMWELKKQAEGSLYPSLVNSFYL